MKYIGDIQINRFSLTILEIDIVDNLVSPGPIPRGFALFKANTLVPLLDENNQINGEFWSPVNAPFRTNSQGRSWFEVQLNPEDKLCYFAVAVLLDNSPQIEPVNP